MPRERGGREWKVGLLVLIAIALFVFGVFLIGEQSNLFSSKNEYVIYFRTVSGLNEGNPVQLNGVEVGTVSSVVLPTDAESQQIRVEIEVERRYAERVREDSQARIKTLGLLGDKFVELTSGSPDKEPIPPGGVISAAAPTDVDRLIASGEDVMDNVVRISADLRDILSRMEQGEGLLGELTTESETGRRMTDSVIETMESIQRVVENVEQGDGTLSRLINDPELANRITGSVEHLEGVLDQAENGDGLLPSLLKDPATKEEFDTTLAQLRQVSENLNGLSTELREGDGLLPRLMGDEEYADEITGEIQRVLERIDNLVTKLDEGEGTAGKLINDPSVYEAVQDVIIGVEESRLLRWLIRNRQKKGIETRYEEEGGPDPGSLKDEDLDRDLEDALRGQEEEPPAAPGEGGNDLGNEGRNRR
jgi:phospholipid/cholesterol/gamma-HCH transport system substrate-binding protein